MQYHITFMQIGIALKLLEGHRVTNIPSKPHEPPGVHKVINYFIGPILEVHRIPEIETNN